LNLRGDIVVRENTIALPQAAHAEETIAHSLQQIGKRLRKINPRHLAEWIGIEGAQLNDEQRAAVSVLAYSPAAILTGDPGTGKTVTVKALAAVLERAGYQVHLTAPTGRAAARLAEATGKPAQTLHRLLHNSRAQQPLRELIASPIKEAIIVDEASMLDLFLAERLARFCTPRTKLILVGDAQQLPPVGPGQVFRDLIESGQLPIVELTRSFRQSVESGIAIAAKQVKAGIVPELLSPAEAKSDSYFIEAGSAFEIQQLIVNAATSSLPRRCGADPYRDIQVLAPMRGGPLGTNALNNLIRSALNCNADEPPQSALHRFQINDRVLQTRNDYSLGVFNGECGIVEESSGEGIIVRFGERRVTYPRSASASLAHGFAITIRRSQGSEYPFVIIPVHESQGAMLSRELLYTALTRGKRMVVFIGSRRAFAQAIGNTRNHRHTGLKTLLSSLPASHLKTAA
jgi:exodeoxyribonuclease V alpha subunit